jgi:undecaprenyl-diphosphatase
MEHWFGVHEPQTLFDVSLHVGTLIATCIVFRVELKRVIVAGLSWLFRRVALSESEDARLALLLLVGTVPTGVIGLTLGPRFEGLFSAVPWVGGFLILNGFILFSVRSKAGVASGRGFRECTWKDALCIGAVQGFAILRGISRSGSTIAAGLWLGLRRETAAVFSFLLSVPAILGALVVSSADGGGTSVEAHLLLLGVGVSAVVGYGALRVLLAIVGRGSFHRFAPYCWGLGFTVLALHGWGG